jgi:hypothetical protein
MRTMKAPKHREYVHHVRTERGVSTYQIRRGLGKDAEVVATVAVTPDQVTCVDCRSTDCSHAARVRERAQSGR